MPTSPWTDDFKTSDSLVDAHHRTLINLLFDLAEATSSPCESAVIDAKLETIERYASFHFTAEEQMMETAGYPDTLRHRREHEVCASKLRQLIEMHSAGNLILSHTIPEYLAKWFIDHITSKDRMMVSWIRRAGGALAGSGHWAIREKEHSWVHGVRPLKNGESSR